MIRKAAAAWAGVLALATLGASAPLDFARGGPLDSARGGPLDFARGEPLDFARGGQEEKVQLRYKFEKGQKFQLAIRYAMNVKLQQVPEALKGLMGETPVDLKVEALLEAEVKDTAEDGKAAVEGKWRTLKVKGNMFINEVDFAHDSEKPEGEKAPKKDSLPGDFDLEESLRAMVKEPAKLTMEPSGRVRLRGGGGGLGAGEVAEQFLSLNGLMGPFPADPIGKGGSWKSRANVQMPGVGGAVAVAVQSENTYEGDETVDGRPCVVLKSKYAVGREGEPKEDPNDPLPFRFKTSGSGEGRNWFCAREGMAVKYKGGVSVDFSAGFPDPGGGGGDIEIKGVLKIDQGYEVRK